jgi:hypothetical protein
VLSGCAGRAFLHFAICILESRFAGKQGLFFCVEIFKLSVIVLAIKEVLGLGPGIGSVQ